MVRLILILFCALNLKGYAQNNFGLKDSSHVFIYTNNVQDTTCLVQLLLKKDHAITVKSCVLNSSLGSVKKLKYPRLDSIITGQVVHPYIRPCFSTLVIDSLLYISDSIFFSNNSVYSKITGMYYVKFNELKLEEPYSVFDLIGIFVLRINSKKTHVKFWSSNSEVTFSYPLYVFQRHFWFLSYCEGFGNCYTLKSFNGREVSIDPDNLFQD